MKKIIKLAIENTTQIRKTEDSLCELYSHDKNNGVFEFEVINETLGNEKPYAMFKFMDSQSVWKVPGTVEDNKIKILFDTTLITQDETVVCFLYLDDEERTTDFYRFKFKVKVSEIDKLDTYAVKERYFNNSIIVDKVDVVTKKELEEALKGLTVSSVEGVLTETRADELYAKKSEIYDDTALKQRVATLEERPDNNTVYDDSDLRGRVEALESKPDNNTVYDDTVLTNRVKALEERPTGSSYDDSDLQGRVRALEERPTTTTAYDDTDVKRRLTNLEERPDNNTVYDDTDVQNRLKAIEDTQKDYVRTEDLPAPYDDRRVNERLEALEIKTDNDTVYNDTDLKTRVEALENRTTTSVTAYDDSDLKRRVSELEQRPDNNTVYDDTDVKERLTNLETKVDKDTIYDDSELKRRVSELEQRPDNNTIYDDSALTQRVETLENKPEGATKEDVKGLTDRVVALENKSDKDTIYDDSDIKERLTVLENKPDNNTVYDDSALSNRVRALEDAPKINATDFATKNDLVAFNGELNNKVSSVDFEDFKKTIPAPYNDSSLVKRLETLETKQDKDTVYNDEPIKERLIALEGRPSEMRGTGMPNGVVEAPIGATYVDTAKTNGALKWIKTTDGGNTGWKVAEGDTGWVLGWQENIGDNKNRMYFRRKNDVVHVKFNPEIKTSRFNNNSNLILEIGGYWSENTLSINGFKPVDDIVQTIYGTSSDIYSNTSSAENSEGSQGTGVVIIQYEYNRVEKSGLKLQIVTSDLGVEQNHVNPFSYLTEDEWPVQLP